MPSKGIDGRSHVLATLAGLRHDKLTAHELRDVLQGLREANGALGDIEKAQVAELWRAHDKATRVPGTLVRRLAEVRSRATAAWAEARGRNDFPAFAPHLQEVLKLTRDLADALGYQGHPYNALLDEYEPDARVDEIGAVLSEVKEFLIPFVKRIQESGRKPDLAPVRGPFEHARQEEFCRRVISAMGFDLEGGRFDRSAHPFCTGIHHGDVRLTLRYKDDIAVALFGIMHEAGHGLYEQGSLGAFPRSPLGHVQSLGIHESQSRLWENNVGRSLPFWRRFYPELRAMFPEVLGATGMEQFYAAINDVRPSLIRIEADEVTYNLHIVIRFEIETELMGGGIPVDELPGVWNEKYERYLGITPPDAASGVMQDIHWSSGLIGYFPTYTLGTLNAAQLYAAAERAIPDLAGKVERGELLPLKEWLGDNVHRHGSRFKPRELMTRATGRPTSAENFTAYLKEKYEPLYGLR